MAFKEYLGDSVYVETDDDTGGIVMTTENGFPSDPSNVIFLDPELVDTLFRYVKRVKFLMGLREGGE